ncbi:hypothetical protein DBZ36_09770 [Alginatibacterium sediminis]|uniref:Uncharacterized protein n=1 Tax=Alginatibacterium sediminis TaxID=2164068 RepID=A0A420EDD1_9ALTE|nr:hypothetical protein [Alginatibacterium sediminis]RKF18680.1 hypothetical protein DBZ36_09770 [Alginatibacterium sediminis]
MIRELWSTLLNKSRISNIANLMKVVPFLNVLLPIAKVLGVSADAVHEMPGGRTTTYYVKGRTPSGTRVNGFVEETSAGMGDFASFVLLAVTIAFIAGVYFLLQGPLLLLAKTPLVYTLSFLPAAVYIIKNRSNDLARACEIISKRTKVMGSKSMMLAIPLSIYGGFMVADYNTVFRFDSPLLMMIVGTVWSVLLFFCMFVPLVNSSLIVRAYLIGAEKRKYRTILIMVLWTLLCMWFFSLSYTTQGGGDASGFLWTAADGSTHPIKVSTIYILALNILLTWYIVKFATILIREDDVFQFFPMIVIFTIYVLFWTLGFVGYLSGYSHARLLANAENWLSNGMFQLGATILYLVLIIWSVRYPYLSASKEMNDSKVLFLFRFIPMHILCVYFIFLWYPSVGTLTGWYVTAIGSFIQYLPFI